MSRFGARNKFTAHAGKRDELAEILLGAAAEAREVEGCELYRVYVSETEPNVVWVNEIWRDEADQKATLALESTKAAIARAIPLIAEPIKGHQGDDEDFLRSLQNVE